jgi:hypothetical protein
MDPSDHLKEVLSPTARPISDEDEAEIERVLKEGPAPKAWHPKLVKGGQS